MKKFSLICLFLVILLAGCTKKEQPVPKVTPTLDASESPSQTPVPTSTPTPTPSPVLLGSAQTEILDFQDSRIHNIELSIGQINGYTLAPGQSFSFNRVVGPRTADKGYQKATVLMHGEKTQDYGGGVCQVSSTLFQAARAAGLTVTQRHSHQKDVGYAHPGDDAAVDYGNKDMCFTNNTGVNIKIEATVGGGVVRAEIYQLP